MHIACSINKEYIPHMCAMVLSACLNTSAKKIVIHVLHAELDKIDESIIKDEFNHYKQIEFYFYKIDQSVLKDIPIVAKHLSIETLYRLLLPSVLPKEIEKVLYIDSDIIIKDDLMKVWENDISKYFLAAVTNLEGNMYKKLELESRLDYFNAGFILINLKKWREERFFSKCLNYVKHNSDKIIFADQDILNGVLKGKWKRLHPKWNVLRSVFGSKKLFEQYYDLETYEEIVENPSVIHYTGPIKPWHINSEHPLKNDYYLYASQLRWKEEFPKGLKVLKSSDIYLFGTGKYSKKVTNILNEYNVSLVGYIDNNKEVWNKLINYLPVHNPKEVLLKQQESSIIIIIASSFYEEILEQIEREYKVPPNIRVISFQDLHRFQ